MQDNLFPKSAAAWSHTIPDGGHTLVKYIDETSDSHLLKTIGRKHSLVARFFEEVESNPIVGQYVRDYVERRLLKCYEILATTSIPIFLKEKKFNNLYRDHLLTAHPQPAEPVFHFGVTPTESWYSLSASIGGEPLRLKHRDAQIICNNPAIIRLGTNLYRFNGIDAKKLSPFFTNPRVAIPLTAKRKYFETFVLNAIRNQMVEAEGFTIEQSPPPRRAILSLEGLLNGSLGLVLMFRYGNKSYLGNSLPQREVTMREVGHTYHYTLFDRDVAWEQEVKNSCTQVGLTHMQGAEYLPINPLTSRKQEGDHYLIHWLTENGDALAQAGFTVEQKPGHVQYYLKRHTLALNASPNNDWFDVHGFVELDGFRIPFMSLRKNILSSTREFVLPNGQIFLLPVEWFARFKPIFRATKDDDESVRVGRYHFPALENMGIKCPDVAELRERFMQVESVRRVEIPEGLKATLRPYQKQGLFWLQLLHSNGLGGCLADDMGLGKTIQTIAILLYNLKNGKARERAPQPGVVNLPKTALIVLPTSLIFNWRREIEVFAPSLKVHTHLGTQRQRSIKLLKEHHVVLTTYGTMRNDIDFLKDIRFSYLVLDECQMLKNPMSKGYRAAMLLKAHNTLTLSGTPIENSLSDLWAQLNIANRGMLGSLKMFTADYIIPIEKEGDVDKSADLKKLIQPFILRRTKEEAAKDLPPLSEQVVYCDMAEEQRAEYEEEKSAIRNIILESISAIGYRNSAIPILRGLTRLRQLANHPAMINPDSQTPSGKFEHVVNSLENLLAEGHKIIIFSSFVKHLRIVEKHLAGNGIGYRMLIGASRNRGEMVDSFQSDPNIPVFLISIKAGGIGLNLTAADYIFVLDPWWNPAVENQAVARAHRIGQDKSVFVYRFISVDTVEEKIIKLQERKKLLASEFIGNNNPLSLISEEQMMGMLE